MTRAKLALARRWRWVAVVAALLFLGGAIGVAFLRIDREQHRADLAVAEANLRGDAVSTLAGDVRALREQVEAKGGTPVAPDPARAVPSLSARAEVPVPIPGSAGPSGATGAMGATGATGPAGPTGASGVPGAQGREGASGVPGVGAAGPAGPAGPAGVQGEAGVAGPQGPAGQDGVDGQPPSGWTYTWTDSMGATHTVTCSRASGFDSSAPQYDCVDSTESPSPSAPSNPQAGVLVLSAVLTRRRGDARSRSRAAPPRPYGRHRAGGAHR